MSVVYVRGRINRINSLLPDTIVCKPYQCDVRFNSKMSASKHITKHIRYCYFAVIKSITSFCYGTDKHRIDRDIKHVSQIYTKF